MKKEDNRFCQLKYKLRELKMRRTKSIAWRLTKEEREYIENLGYRVEPYLYEIRTRTFTDLFEINNSLVRDIHYSCKKRKKTVVLRLNRKEKKVLDEYHIKYRPVKFQIFLLS